MEFGKISFVCFASKLIVEFKFKVLLATICVFVFLRMCIRQGGPRKRQRERDFREGRKERLWLNRKSGDCMGFELLFCLCRTWGGPILQIAKLLFLVSVSLVKTIITVVI